MSSVDGADLCRLNSQRYSSTAALPLLLFKLLYSRLVACDFGIRNSSQLYRLPATADSGAKAALPVRWHSQGMKQSAPLGCTGIPGNLFERTV